MATVTKIHEQTMYMLLLNEKAASLIWRLLDHEHFSGDVGWCVWEALNDAGVRGGDWPGVTIEAHVD